MTPDLREAHSPLATPGAAISPRRSDWAKPPKDAPQEFSEEFLKFSASILRAQADFLDGLSDCKDPRDVFKIQGKFLQIWWDLWLSSAASLSRRTSGASAFARSLR